MRGMTSKLLGGWRGCGSVVKMEPMAWSEEYFKEGLTEAQAQELLVKHGPNEIVRKERDSDLALALRQFVNPLVALLLGAMGLTLATGHNTDALLIGIAVVINAVLGFVQERRAARGLEALRDLVAPTATVIRDGKRKTVEASSLVPGDVVWLTEGDRVSADGVIVSAVDLSVNEAILTGESLSVMKEVYDESSSEEHEGRAFMGTLIVGGVGTMVVEKTGANTEMGSIANTSERGNVKTPLEKRISKLAWYITVAVVVVAALVFVWGAILGESWVEMFTVAVALAVSATPEGLVIALTVILAVGAQRMMKRQALVRKLVAAETLGSVTHVCVDKTGTLTEGKMKVSEVDFVDDEKGYRVALLANDMRDATEIARLEWAREFQAMTTMSRGKSKAVLMEPEEMTSKFVRDEAIAFSTDRRFLAVRYGNEVMVAGAPDLLLTMSDVNKETFRQWERKLSKWAREGKRVIGFIAKQYKKESDAKAMMESLRDGKGTLEWVGMMAFADPVRSGVRQALQTARQAGIKVVVITGDYRDTALWVMKSLGLHPKSDEVIEGWELEKMSDADLSRAVKSTVLFARTRPAQKLRIVKALQKQGAVVGMMGDGVNDAPALAAADIGMVVGEATDLAKDAADLVLLDSNFATIVAAIEEGRGIYDNIRKVITFLLGMAFSEVLVVLGSLFLGWELALTAAQILWINLVTDGFPYMALTVDPKDKNVLQRKPVDSKLPLVDGKLLVMIGVMSLVTAGLALLTYVMWMGQGTSMAQTGVFLVISMGTLIYVFACRSLDEPIWVEKPWGNMYLVGSVVIGGLLTYAAVSVGVLQDLLSTTSPGAQGWMWVGMCAVLVLVGAEGVKLVLRRR